MGKGKEHDPFKLKTRQNGHEDLTKFKLQRNCIIRCES